MKNIFLEACFGANYESYLDNLHTCYKTIGYNYRKNDYMCNVIDGYGTLTQDCQTYGIEFAFYLNY